MSAWGVLLHFLGLGICLLGLTWRKKQLVAGTLVAIAGFLVGTSPFWLLPYFPHTHADLPHANSPHTASPHTASPQTAPPQQSPERPVLSTPARPHDEPGHSTQSSSDASMSLEALNQVLEPSKNAPSSQQSASPHEPSAP